MKANAPIDIAEAPLQADTRVPELHRCSAASAADAPFIARGLYQVREALTPKDVARAQAFRHIAFHGVPGRDEDGYDPFCRHFLVEEQTSGRLLCCFRVMLLPDGAALARSYSAQFYDLAALAPYPGPLLEIGRFCVDPEVKDPDVVRLAWGALTRLVDGHGVTLLFGCGSFSGTAHAPYDEAFALLKKRHLAPQRWMPRTKAPDIYRYAARLRRTPNAKRAMQVMPPVLRSCLLMGGWVSDHAVVDAQMNTLHVFTGVEISAIPPARKRLLRAVAG